MLRAFNALMILALLFFSQYWSDIAVAAESSQANYPHRPVRILVGFAPGGSDIPARILAQKLYEKLGQPFIVDNRPGAGGIIGTDIASKATADGYTLLFATASFPVTAGAIQTDVEACSCCMHEATSPVFTPAVVCSIEPQGQHVLGVGGAPP